MLPQICRWGVVLLAIIKPLAWLTYIRAWQQIMSVLYLAILSVAAAPYAIRVVGISTCSALTRYFPGKLVLSAQLPLAVGGRAVGGGRGTQSMQCVHALLSCTYTSMK